MKREGEEVHMDETEASAGSKEGVVRWVLIVGLFLAIALLTLIWVTGAAFQGDIEEEATVSGRIEAVEDDNDIDSIVGEDADAIEGADLVEDTGELESDTIEN